MKGADSHGSCKNYYKNFVIAGAYMPDNHTAGGYVHHMAVCNGISYPVGNHLYHSVLGYGFGQETGTEAFRMLAMGFILYVLPILAGWIVVWLEAIKIRLMGD